MKIGFDAKRAFNNSTGLGNYSRSVIDSVTEHNQKDQFHLFTTNTNDNIFNINRPNTHIIKPTKGTNKNYWRFKSINNDINKLNIDLFHGLSNELPYGISIKSIVTIHDLLFLKYPQFYNIIDRNIYNFKSKYACEKAIKIIAISKQTKEDIINYYNINPKKIDVIYQSCHRDYINLNKKVQIDSQLKNQISKPYILFVGGAEKRKNLQFLLKAVKKIDDIKLICVGKLNKKIKNFIKQNNLEHRVTFLTINCTKILAEIYKRSQGLIYPSIDEGFGIPIIEAMYCSVPVVISDNQIFKEIGGEHAYYFKQNQLESLIQQIKKITIESDERRIRIEKNLNYVKKFNEHSQAKKLSDLYHNLT
ncbi:MAG: glycosyltransferase family 1 protein [Flavobacteriales bacterium TMED191]|nr:MAG: glycosyltransferase family 1 protein [Flavobacteriales bacterium TMED191]